MRSLSPQNSVPTSSDGGMEALCAVTWAKDLLLFFWRGKVLASQSYRIDMVTMARKYFGL